MRPLYLFCVGFGEDKRTSIVKTTSSILSTIGRTQNKNANYAILIIIIKISEDMLLDPMIYVDASL